VIAKIGHVLLPRFRAVQRLVAKPLQLFVFTQFRTKNRYALFLELL